MVTDALLKALLCSKLVYLSLTRVSSDVLLFFFLPDFHVLPVRVFKKLSSGLVTVCY